MNDDILTRIDTAWEAFLPSFEGLAEEQASEPGVAGYYSVKDLLAHLAWWENQTRRVVETGRDEPIDVEAINDKVYAEYKGVSFDELKQLLIDGHERARATFAAAASLTDHDVKDDTWEHWEDHGEQIRTWRAARGI